MSVLVGYATLFGLLDDVKIVIEGIETPKLHYAMMCE